MNRRGGRSRPGTTGRTHGSLIPSCSAASHTAISTRDHLLRETWRIQHGSRKWTRPNSSTRAGPLSLVRPVCGGQQQAGGEAPVRPPALREVGHLGRLQKVAQTLACPDRAAQGEVAGTDHVRPPQGDEQCSPHGPGADPLDLNELRLTRGSGRPRTYSGRDPGKAAWPSGIAAGQRGFGPLSGGLTVKPSAQSCGFVEAVPWSGTAAAVRSAATRCWRRSSSWTRWGESAARDDIGNPR
jgi:hypothetical protein